MPSTRLTVVAAPCLAFAAVGPASARERRGSANASRAAARRWIAVLCLAAIAVFCAVGAGRAAEPAPTFEASTVTVVTAAGPHRLTVELATTAAQRSHGLMFRRTMAADHGMLFDFGRDTYVSMWMKNTFIPLDMLFIDAAGRVAHIARDTKPMSLDIIDAPGRVRAVLELNAGAAARLGVRVGDRVRHALFGNAAG